MTSPPSRPYTRTELVTLLQAAQVLKGSRPLTWQDVREQRYCLPPVRQLLREFESWSAALDAAGLERSPAGRPPRRS